VTEPNRIYKLDALAAVLVELSEDAIFVAGVNGLIQSWNPGAVALLGHTAEQAVGRDVSMFLRPGREEALQAFFKYVRAGQKVRDVESSFVRSDGTLADVRISVAPLADTTGEVVAFVAVFRDLSERKRQEAALRAKGWDVKVINAGVSGDPAR